MTANELIEHLSLLGVHLWAESGQLRFRAAKGVLTNDHKQQLREHKAELLAILSEASQQESQAASPFGVEVKADPSKRHEPFPLTDVQTAYLLGRQHAFGLGGVACHGYLEMHFAHIDVNALETAWSTLIARHPMLRAVIEREGFQRVLTDVPAYKVHTEDYQTLSATQCDAALHAVRESLDHHMYPIGEWPMFTLRHSRTASGDIVHFSMDALIADWASVNILLGELDTLLLDPQASLAPLSIDFRDYLIAERSLLDQPAYQHARRYWFDRVDDLPNAPDLPQLHYQHQQHQQTHDTQSSTSVRFVRHHHRLDAAHWQRFKHYAGEAGLTASVAVLAAYAAVLQRWSRQARFSLSLTLLNRLGLHPEVNQILGDFTSVSILSIDDPYDASGKAKPFSQWAAAIGQQLFSDLDHRLCSGVEVLREVAKRRGADDASMPVVFTSAIGLGVDEARDAAQRAVGRTLGSGITQTPQVTLDCQVRDDANGLEINWDVRQGIFPDGLVDDMFAAFTQLLAALSAAPFEPAHAASSCLWHRESPVALPEWQVAQRDALNHTPHVTPLPECYLHQGVFAQAHATPDAIAIIDTADSEQTHATYVTYAELAKQAGGIAAVLSEHPLTPRQPVAIALNKGRAQIAATLGVLLADGAYLPLDVTQPEIRLHKLLRPHNAHHADTTLVITNRELAQQIHWPDTVTLVFVETCAPTASLPSIPEAPSGDALDDLAYVIFTSGSTGDPKGVMISHRAAMNTIWDINQRFSVSASDRMLGLAQLSFDLSVYDIFGPLAVGAALVLPNPSRGADPSHWAAVAAEHEVTLWNSVPAQLDMLASYLDSEPQNLHRLRLTMLSGDWIPLTLPTRIRRHIPALAMVGMGGATEASIWSNYHLIDTVDPCWRSIPYGRPLAQQGFRVLDKQGRDAPVWVPGELTITGAGLAKGYLGDPALSNSKFCQHPLDGERLYRTGDLGRYLPSGELEFLGREDGQVKIRGHRIELGEVTAALGAHPAVAQAAAVITHKNDDTQDSDNAQAEKILLGFVQSDFIEGAAPVRIDEKLHAAVSQFAYFQAGEPSAEALNEYAASLQRASLLSMLHGLMRLGVFTTPEQSYSAKDIIDTAQVAAKHHWLVRRWLGLLVDAGMLQCEQSSTSSSASSAANSAHGTYYWCVQKVDEAEVHRAWQTVEQGVAWGFCSADFVAYHRQHVQLLPQLLADQQNPFELLFPQGSQHMALSLYRDDVIARYNNNAAAALVNRIAAQHKRHDRRMNILELGAGTGATSASVLPLLDGFDADYLFTDMTAFFLPEAKARFQASSHVRFGLLDINNDYRAQGMQPNNADIIICAGMLNSTHDAQASLAQIVELLRPGGWLIMTEPTQDHAHILLTQGFMMDPSNDDHAFGHSKFQSLEQWQNLLLQHQKHSENPTQTPYASIMCLPCADDPLAVMGIHFLAAQFKTDRESLTQNELRDFISQRLPKHMLPSHVQIVDQLPLTANGKVDRKRLATWRPVATDIDEQTTSDALDPLEMALCTLWANALGLESADKITPTDSFFDHGADSLILARVAGRLLEDIPEAKAFTYDALLRCMLNEPNVAALARHLNQNDHSNERQSDSQNAHQHHQHHEHAPQAADHRASSAQTQPCVDNQSMSNALLVPFKTPRAHTSTETDERPVRVMFHAALGTLDYFQHLGNALAAQDLGPVIGIAVANTDDYLAIDAKALIERTADNYAQRLIDEGYQRCQLIGYCLGGLLATEVARRLLARGVDVVDLSLIDSIPMFVDTDEELAFEAIFAPNLNLDPVKAVFGDHVAHDDVSRAIETLMHKNDGKVPAGSMAELDDDAGLRSVADAVRQRHQFTQAQRLAQYTDMAAAQAGIPVAPEMIPGLFSVCRHSMRAACFDLPPYMGDITYLRCLEEQSFGVSAGVGHMSAPYWQDVCYGDFTLIDVPGNHFSVMQPPQVNTVVEHLAKPLLAWQANADKYKRANAQVANRASHASSHASSNSAYISA